MQLRVPETMNSGTKVKCPKCAVTFETPSADAPPPAPAAPTSEYAPRPYNPPDLPTRGGATEGPHYNRPAWDANEFSNLDDGGAYRGGYGVPEVSPDYTIDVGAFFARAREHWSSVVGPMIGYFFVMILIDGMLGIVPCIGPLARAFLDPALQAGFIIVSIKQMQGRSWTFGDFFSGFNWWASIWGAGFLAGLATLVCFLPGIIMFMAVHDSRNQVLIGIAIFLVLIGAVTAVYVYVRMTLFAVPLIVDRRCGATDALSGSWKMTEGHFFGWLGVMMLLGAIIMVPLLPGMLVLIAGAANNADEVVMVGFLALLAGGFCLMFTLPFVSLVNAAGYLSLVRPPPSRELESPM